MQLEQDGIAGMLEVVRGNIADVSKLNSQSIDTIVNAAKPTLMGSNQGVDGAIHHAIDNLLRCSGSNESFKDKICDELNTRTGYNIIRCNRGQAVLTSGYGLCNHVIHVVGAQYDGSGSRWEDCSSSRVQILESCYYEIVKQIKNHLDIKRIAIPIIASGEYGFPFRTAAQIAIASIGNALIEWKEQDPEMFEIAGIEKIYFFIYHSDAILEAENYEILNEILNIYKPILKKGRKVVFQSSVKAHFRYFWEIIRYDELRGYFSIAKWFRIILMIVRIIFVPVMILKDKVGKEDWKSRRWFIEFYTFAKCLIPLGFWKMLGIISGIRYLVAYKWTFSIIIIYCMCDTVTYLMILMVMADIQRPSANIIRSMIMLLVNYIEVSLDMAFLYYVYYQNKGILFREAAMFGILGEQADIVRINTIFDYIFLCADAGLKFFFTSLIFGYFANHMRQRRFRS